MRNICLFLSLVIGLCTIAFGQPKTPRVPNEGLLYVASPSGAVTLRVGLNEDQQIEYQVFCRGQQAIKPSTLGLYYAGYANPENMRGERRRFGKGLTLLAVDSARVNETWKPVLGEVAEIRNNYRQVRLFVGDSSGAAVNITFRVFDDGVGFRYEMTKAGVEGSRIIMLEEQTTFTVNADHTAWWMSGDYDSNEFAPMTTRLSEIDGRIGATVNEIFAKTPFDTLGVQTPLLMRSDAGLYINIHEAALVNYPVMQLEYRKQNNRFTSNLCKDAVGNAAYLPIPFQTPWRTIVVSDKATDLLASKLILNLNEPCKIADPSWIKPTKFIGVWWEMHIGKGTWNYGEVQNGRLVPNGKHAANTENVMRYIDFASKHGFDGVLVEGWNVGWEDWFGKWKEDVFDFVTPYPDFDVARLQKYAQSKGVKLIMHHETSSSVTNYQQYMDTAYAFMHRYGYDAVKTGYVGRIIPRGEHHDGQWMVNHYNKVVEATARERIMVDMHECARPTGMNRTWPNWVANEAARGQEFCNSGAVGNLPEHETILPFTRLMGGPMDYTPGMFEMKLNAFRGADRPEAVHTTLAKQLALYVTMYSPFQMAADLPENYEKHLDALQFIKDVAADWDDTRYLKAEPGDYIVVARKAKATQNWFLGAITDEKKRAFDVSLDFLTEGINYEAIIYADAPNAHYDTNPSAYVISKKKVNSKTVLALNLAEGGGCAISIMPAK